MPLIQWPRWSWKIRRPTVPTRGNTAPPPGAREGGPVSHSGIGLSGTSTAKVREPGRADQLSRTAAHQPLGITGGSQPLPYALRIGTRSRPRRPWQYDHRSGNQTDPFPQNHPGFTEAMNHLKASRGFFIIPEGAAFPLSENVTAISLAEYLGKGDERSWK